MQFYISLQDCLLFLLFLQVFNLIKSSFLVRTVFLCQFLWPSPVYNVTCSLFAASQVRHPGDSVTQQLAAVRITVDVCADAQRDGEERTQRYDKRECDG